MGILKKLGVKGGSAAGGMFSGNILASSRVRAALRVKAEELEERRRFDAPTGHARAMRAWAKKAGYLVK